MDNYKIPSMRDKPNYIIVHAGTKRSLRKEKPVSDRQHKKAQISSI